MQTSLLIVALLFVGVQADAKPTDSVSSANQGSVAHQQGQQVLVPVSAVQQSAPVAGESVHQSQAVNQPAHLSFPPSSFYGPAGVVTVVGNEPQQVAPKQAAPVAAAGAASQQQGPKNFEQYGQPESAALPPNYKPFGSWGLYIGGNPADGYYTNYYKALSASVKENKPEQPQAVLKASAPSGEAYYPYVYSQGDFATVYNQHPVIQPVSNHYGSPSYDVQGYEQQQHSGLVPAEVYSAARKAASPQQAAPVVQKEVLVKGDNKAYVQPQSRVYVYSPPVASHVVSPVATRAQVQEQQQQQVVAYPVPVGSQIVGSQAGVDGSFYPYGVHAFTRYVVKPTLVAQEQHQTAVVPQQPQQHSAPAEGVVAPAVAYSSQAAAVQQPAVRVYYGGYQPYYGVASSYYGYPVNQLHYSQLQQQVGEHPSEYHHPYGVMSSSAKPVSPVESKPVNEEARLTENVLSERRA